MIKQITTVSLPGLLKMKYGRIFQFVHIVVGENIKKSIEYPVIISFIFSCLILTIVWMPKHSGLYIRVLREIKTVFLTLAISSLIISMTTTIFVH